jgi:hypothetical protein
MGELVGMDTYLQAGGRRFADGIFAPSRLRRFSGPNAAVDPYGLTTEGMQAELRALKTLNDRVDLPSWQGLISLAPELGGAVYFGHVEAMLNAQNASELLEAHNNLSTDLNELR